MKKRFFFLIFIFTAVFVGCEKIGPEPQKEYFTLWNPYESLTALTEYVTDVTRREIADILR